MDLQARITAYEQGEIERSVALQALAKRLKEENEVLRKENEVLREKVRKRGVVEGDEEGERTSSRRKRVRIGECSGNLFLGSRTD